MNFTKVYIVILNWNGWKDTIECLESVFRLDYDNYCVIVCDNDSSDGSLEYIKAWADGRLDVYVPQETPLRHLSFPPVPKLISYQQYNRNDAEAGGIIDDADLSLILIQTGANLGFAGGNNVGLRYALTRNDCEYVWLLNNDTVIESHSLSFLFEKAGGYKSTGNKVGIISSKLMFYNNPLLIQGLGGVYNKWFATAKHIGLFDQDHGQYDTEELIDKADYPIGASMFVSKEFVQDVGLMCEDYFLYFEEIDWVLRGKRRDWQIGYCWQARIFHKEGGTIGTSSIGANKSELSDYFGLKNRIIFTKKFYPDYLWSVRFAFIMVLFNRIRRRKLERLGLVLSAFLGKPFQHSKSADDGRIKIKS